MSNKIKILLFTLLPIVLLTIIIVIFYVLSGTEENKKETTEPEEYYEADQITFKNEGGLEVSEDNGDVLVDNIDQKEKEEIYSRISDINIDQAQMIDNKIYFYSKEEKAYGVLDTTSEKNETEILLTNLPPLSEAVLSPAGDKLLYKDFNKDTYVVHDLDTKEKKELSSGIKTALWHPMEKNKIIGIYSKSNINNINIYDLKNNNREELLNLFINNGILVDITQDGAGLIYTRSEPLPTYEGEIENVETEVESTIKTELVLFDMENKKNVWQREDIDKGKFSPDSDKLLVSKPSTGLYPVLAILDFSDKETILNLGTYLNKVEFIDSDNLVYAKIEGLRDNHYQDTIWKYNLKTGRYSRVTRLEDGVIHDVSNIMPTADGKKIYFINRYDNKIYLVDTEK